MIPRQLHLCWLSGEPYPPLIERCLASWRTQLPEYRIVHWDAQALARRQWPRWVHEAVAARKFAFAADYIRLHALWEQGGIYLDADVEVVQSLDDLLQAASFIGRETGGDLEPAVIGAVSGLPWLAAAREYYAERPFRRSDGSLDQRPLPIVLAQVLGARFGFDAASVAASREELALPAAQLRLLPAEVVSPKCRITGRVHATGLTRTIHHFDGQWIDPSPAARLKLAAHRLLIRSLGASRHARIVHWVRKVRAP